jgi:hypothetical protein
MRWPTALTIATSVSLVSGYTACAEDGGPWSATLYVGPATNNYTSQIFHGDFNIEGPALGFALDRHLFDLGAGFSLLAEAQAVHYFFSPPTTTFGLGVGIKYDLLSIAPGAPVTVALYMGPSCSLDPPLDANGPEIPARHRFLNYLSSEVNIGIPHAADWSVSIRSFHRSGMYGLYARGIDEGSMIGVGIRHTF